MRDWCDFDPIKQGVLGAGGQLDSGSEDGSATHAFFELYMYRISDHQCARVIRSPRAAATGRRWCTCRFPPFEQPSSSSTLPPVPWLRIYVPVPAQGQQARATRHEGSLKLPPAARHAVIEQAVQLHGESESRSRLQRLAAVADR